MRPDSKIERATSGTRRIGLLFLAMLAMAVLTASIAIAGAPTRLPAGAPGQKQGGAANSAAEYALAPSSHCTPTTFITNTRSVDSSPFALASGYFNNDGNRDLVSASNISSTLSVLLGSPSGVMSPATSFPAKPGGGAQSVAVGDFNLDGKQDLVAGNLNTADVSVLLGDGAGSFGATFVFTAGTQPAGVAVGDFNNDTKPDVLVANFGDDDVTVLLNTCVACGGTPSFSYNAATDVPVGDGPYYRIAVGFFNADANLDFATHNYNSANVSVRLGAGNGTFSGANYGVAALPESIAAGDLDNDGDVDLVTAHRNADTLSVLLNNGTGVFAGAVNVSTPVGTNPSSVGIGDFDDDGNADLAVTFGGTDKLAIMLGNGTGTSFQPPSLFAADPGPNSVIVEDFNNDGVPDAALASSGPSTVTVYINGCTAHTPTPTLTSTGTVIPPTSTSTNTPAPTNTSPPTNTPDPTNTPLPTNTSAPTNTSPPATSTDTALPATSTSTGTIVPPTSTDTSVPATSTSTATVEASSTVAGATSTPQATATVCTINFPDNQPGDTFYEYIQCLACRHIVTGFPDGMFHAERNITRGQISKMVSNAAGFFEDPGPQIYDDVPPGSPYYDYINRLTNRGIMSGYPCPDRPSGGCSPDNPVIFLPNANATRGQLAKIVSNAAGFNEAVSGQHYEDVPPTGEGSQFYEWIMRLTNRGVMGGYPCGGPGESCAPADRPYFRWNVQVTRGQASKIVANTFFPNCEERVD